MADDIEFRLKALEDDSKRNSDQHREFYAAMKQIEKQNAVTEERYNTILTTMSETKAAVEDIKTRPAKRRDTIITAAITGVVSFVIGFLLRGGA